MQLSPPECELKGPRCKPQEATSSYECPYCCTDAKTKVHCCANCLLDLYRKKSNVCQKPGCVEHEKEILAQRSNKKAAEKSQRERERKEQEERKQQEAAQKLDSDLTGPLEEVKTTFKDCPTILEACTQAPSESKYTVQAVIRAARAAGWAAANIPDANVDQMFKIFYYAFSRDSSVTLGGSRVRAYFVQKGTPYKDGEVPYKPLSHQKPSDLDVGYSRLNAGQADGCRKQATKEGWLPIEDSVIIPGNTIGGKKLESCEEFFQRSGERDKEDLKRKVDGITHYYPSGSITFPCQGGLPVERPPGS